MRTRIYNGFYIGLAILSILLFGSNLGASTLIVTPTLTSFNAVSNTGVWGFAITNLTGSPITILPGSNDTLVFQNTSFSGNLLSSNTASQAVSFLQLKANKVNKALTCANGQASTTNALYNYTLNCPAAVIVNKSFSPDGTIQRFNTTPIANVSVFIQVNVPKPLNLKREIVPSWTNKTAIINATYGINVTVDQIPKLNLNKTVVAPGNYINSTEGINLLAVVNQTTSPIQLPIGGQYHDPIDGRITSVIPVNEILGNKTSMEALFFSQAGAKCAVGANVTFFDNTTNRSLTLCTRLAGELSPSAYTLVAGWNNLTGANFSQGVGVVFTEALQRANTSYASCTTNLAASNKQRDNYSGQLFTCNQNRETTIQTIQGIAEVVVAAGVLIYLFYRFMSRRSRPAPASGGRR